MFEFVSMKRQCTFYVLIFVLLAHSLAAGDIAYFVNLGFSADHDIFMFGQYGVDAESSKPYAESYIVDIQENNFVSGGVAQHTAGIPASPGQDGLGALFTLIGQQVNNIKKYSVDHLNVGRPVYLLVNGSEIKQEISFRDFNTGNAYTIKLRQSTRGVVDAPESAFHIILNATKPDGEQRSETVGRPDYYRENVSSYSIKQVIISPDENSVIIVVERILDYEGGRYLRYMIETTRLYD